jgi:hypothetical protein
VDNTVAANTQTMMRVETLLKDAAGRWTFTPSIASDWGRGLAIAPRAFGFSRSYRQETVWT